MKRLIIALIAAAGMVLLSPASIAQTFAGSGTTTVSVVVAAEASLYISDSTTTLSSTGTLFSDYAGTTHLTYKIRTTKTGGSGTITSLVTADFSGTGGPSVASPPSSGDALTYTCSVSSPATSCTGTQTASTTVAQPVATFGADGHSAKAGNSGQLSWILTNDPQYKTGSYNATVTFTVSAT